MHKKKSPCYKSSSKRKKGQLNFLISKKNQTLSECKKKKKFEIKFFDYVKVLGGTKCVMVNIFLIADHDFVPDIEIDWVHFIFQYVFQVSMSGQKPGKGTLLKIGR